MSELRKIEPISIPGLTPNVPTSGPPIVEWVDPRILWVDPAYQRELLERSMRQIRRIIEQFDWAHLKPPICAYAEVDGETILKVIDGQHTAIGCASNPNVTTIPVVIIEAPETSTQAAAFISHNKDRIAVTSMQMHVAAVAAGDPDALTVQKVCERAGVSIVTQVGGREWRPRETMATAVIDALCKRRGAMHARKVLDVLAMAELAPITAVSIKAVDLLLTDADYKDGFDPADMAAIIARSGDAELNDAKGKARALRQPEWKQLAAVWFRQVKKRRRVAA